MIGSLILFVLFVIVYVLITDVITILFRLTGMTQERARFQAISLLTNSGYTTEESEAVVATSLRRKLARFTMIFGYTFTVTIVSTTVNFFMSLRNSELNQILVHLPLWGAVLGIFYLIRKNRRIKRLFDNAIEKWGTALIFGKNTNQILLMESYGKMVVAHVYLRNVPEMLRDVTLSESGIRTKHNIMVMMVKGLRQEAQQADANTILHPHDLIIVLGRMEDIREVFVKADREAPLPE